MFEGGVLQFGASLALAAHRTPSIESFPSPRRRKDAESTSALCKAEVRCSFDCCIGGGADVRRRPDAVCSSLAAVCAEAAAAWRQLVRHLHQLPVLGSSLGDGLVRCAQAGGMGGVSRSVRPRSRRQPRDKFDRGAAGKFCWRHPLVEPDQRLQVVRARAQLDAGFSRDRPNSTFKYIFSKLDAEELPLFAQADLYVGFEESPEGPRGVNLLRLMCGMRGVPLAPEAVVMAQQVDVDAKQAMARI